MTKHHDTDVKVEDHGSVILLTPLTAEAREWFEQNIHSEGWQWFGGSLAAEPRYVADVVEGLNNAGFAVEGF